MRATVFRQGRLVVDTLPDPLPQAGQVLVRTLACGICGTDLHAMRDGPHMMKQFRRAGVARALDFNQDVVFGHEFCCEIVDYGPSTTREFKPGTRVTALPTGIGLSNTRSGGFGELMLIDADRLLAVPSHLTAEEAALTEPMAVGVHAVAKARPAKDDLPLVIGCGPVGLSVIAALRLAGCAPIVAADFSPRRRQLAETMGADIVIDPGAGSPYTAWRDVAAQSGGQRLAGNLLSQDASARNALIFECAGVPGVLEAILENAPVHARIVMVGACGRTDQFEPMIATLKEVNIQFAVSYTPEEFARTLRHLADGDIDVRPMVTAKVGAAEVSAAVEWLAHPDDHVKIVVEPWR
jgi:threonine dehydrogenase-like Zn-dependent dehydrogenase